MNIVYITKRTASRAVLFVLFFIAAEQAGDAVPNVGKHGLYPLPEGGLFLGGSVLGIGVVRLFRFDLLTAHHILDAGDLLIAGVGEGLGFGGGIHEKEIVFLSDVAVPLLFDQTGDGALGGAEGGGLAQPRPRPAKGRRQPIQRLAGALDRKSVV